jgi:hypothetical protein
MRRLLFSNAKIDAVSCTSSSITKQSIARMPMEERKRKKQFNNAKRNTRIDIALCSLRVFYIPALFGMVMRCCSLTVAR